MRLAVNSHDALFCLLAALVGTVLLPIQDLTRNAPPKLTAPMTRPAVIHTAEAHIRYVDHHVGSTKARPHGVLESGRLSDTIVTGSIGDASGLRLYDSQYRLSPVPEKFRTEPFSSPVPAPPQTWLSWCLNAMASALFGFVLLGCFRFIFRRPLADLRVRAEAAELKAKAASKRAREDLTKRLKSALKKSPAASEVPPLEARETSKSIGA